MLLVTSEKCVPCLVSGQLQSTQVLDYYQSWRHISWFSMDGKPCHVDIASWIFNLNLILIIHENLIRICFTLYMCVHTHY